MAYTVKISPAAEKDLAALPEPIRIRAWEGIRSLANNPRPVGVEKMVNLKDTYRIRVGQYRIGYQIRNHELLVTIVGVGKRDDIYPMVKRRLK